MIPLSDQQRADYLRRSYSAVDGLWFMKVEEKFGFDRALDIDDEVWKVLPKIQARMLKTMINRGEGIAACFDCLQAMLSLDGFSFRVEPVDSNGRYRAFIEVCPWYNAMVDSERGEFVAQVGTRICNSAFSVLAAEFGDDIRFEMPQQICKGDAGCILQFTKQD